MQPLPAARTPQWQGGTGGRVALVAPSWLGASAHFIPFLPRSLRATRPRASSCHPGRALGLALQPGVPKPAVTWRGTEQAQGAALTSGLGILLAHLPARPMPESWM